MQRPPKNCREAFTADGDQVYTNRYYTPEQEVMVRYLGGDPEAEIRQVASYKKITLFFLVEIENILFINFSAPVKFCSYV